MAKEKQHVFSARTTEAGLKALNEVKGRLKVSWDELVVEAVSARYDLDKAMMSLPRKEKPVKEAQSAEQPPIEQPLTSETETEQPMATEQEQPVEEKLPAKKRKKGGKKARGAEVEG